MAVPKRRTSKARRDKRRAHDALPIPVPGICAHCGEPKKRHQACPKCGYYKGREVLEVKD